jgi:hypothetical protein
MKSEHRDVIFDVHQLTEEKWEWIVYPKIGQGTRINGVSPNEGEAKRAARQAIDEALK